MFFKFLKDPLRKAMQDMHPPGVSRTRKILLWVLIIGFWVAYYWFYQPPAP